MTNAQNDSWEDLESYVLDLLKRSTVLDADGVLRLKDRDSNQQPIGPNVDLWLNHLREIEQNLPDIIETMTQAEFETMVATLKQKGYLPPDVEVSRNTDISD
jgi:hypothetical protein